MNAMLHHQVILKRPAKRLKKLIRKFSNYFKWLSVLAGAFAFLFLGRFLLTSAPCFALNRIEVVGDLRGLTDVEILRASGLSLKNNLFSLSLKEIEKNILKLPWARSVSVRREIPSTLWIHVREQSPRAILLDKKLYFVSKEGAAFKEVEGEPDRDLPVITGLRRGDSLLDAIRLVEFLKEIPNFEVFGLSEIHYNEATGFSIVTLSKPMEIRFGHGNFEAKMGRFKNLWSRWKNRLGPIRGIDLDYEDRAFVKL